MTWLTWRQFRVPAGVTAAALAALAVLVVVTGRQLVHVYDANHLASCASDCAPSLVGDLVDKYSWLSGILWLGMLAVPALIGAFWGAPLVAREFETGTYRLAWTQGVSRTRWLATKLAVVGAASMIVAGALSFMVTWWSRPLDWVAGNRFEPGTFDERGIVAVGYTAFAFALAVAAGVLIRRTLPAMVVTLIAFVSVRLAFTNWLRPHLWAPAHLVAPLNADSIGLQITPSGVTVDTSAQPTIAGISSGAWVYSRHLVDTAGHVPTQSALHAFLQSACPSIGAGTQAAGGDGPKAARAGNPEAFQACVTQLSSRFQQVVAYQPASRFWRFQWTETAIFLALALVLAGFCLWWIRERMG